MDLTIPNFHIHLYLEILVFSYLIHSISRREGAASCNLPQFSQVDPGGLWGLEILKTPPIYQRCQKYDVLVLKCIIS